MRGLWASARMIERRDTCPATEAAGVQAGRAHAGRTDDAYLTRKTAESQQCHEQTIRIIDVIDILPHSRAYRRQ